MLNLISNSLVNYALINSSNFKMILGFCRANHSYRHFKTRKNLGFSRFFSQPPESRDLKFYPKLETLFVCVPYTKFVHVHLIYAKISVKNQCCFLLLRNFRSVGSR